MKWVEIRAVHINTDQVQVFRWLDGVLYVWFAGDRDPTKYEDPDREHYVKLCGLLGVRPVEAENHEKK